jgi:hypothetical protein
MQFAEIEKTKRNKEYQKTKKNLSLPNPSPRRRFPTGARTWQRYTMPS